MSDVVAFPVMKPDWLFFVAMRLMIRADRPLAQLHGIAAQLGIPRAMFMRGSGREGSLPYYRLTWPMVWRSIDRFGPMGPPAEESVAARLCFRQRHPRHPPMAAKR